MTDGIKADGVVPVFRFVFGVSIEVVKSLTAIPKTNQEQMNTP
jgi:hypothetical protein